MANEQITIDVLAKDNASKVINKVADEAQSLEKLSPEVVIAASDRATADLDRVLDRTKSLDGDTARVVLEAEAARAEGAISNLQLLLGQVDGEQAVAVLTAKDQASGDLERIQSELRALDGTTATVEVDARGVRDLGVLADALPGRLGDAAGAARGLASGVGGIGIAAGAVAAGALALADNYADAAIEAQTLATLTGATVEESSQLSQVWKETGADTKDLADVMLQVNGALAQSPELAAQLGIEGENAQEVFQNAVEAVRGIQDPLEKARIGSQLFGEEGVRQVGAVLGITEDLNAEVESREPMFSADDARKAQEFKRAMAELTLAMQGIATTVADEIVPGMTDLADSAGPVVEALGPVVEVLLKITEFQATGGFGRIAGEATKAGAGLLSWTTVPGILAHVSGAFDDTTEAAAETHSELETRAPRAWEAEASGARQAHDALTAATEALQEHQAAVQGLFDPLFGMSDAMGTLAEAQARVTELELSGTATEAELAAARRDAVQAALGLTVASDRLTQGVADGSVSLADARSQLALWVGQGLITADQAAATEAEFAGLADTAGALDGTDVNVTAQAHNVEAVDGALNQAARNRTATITANMQVVLDQGSINQIERRALESAGLSSFGAAAPPTMAEAGLTAPLGLGAAPMATTGFLGVARAAPTIIVNVDARGAPDPYAVGRAVAKSLNKWGSIGGQWLPGGRS